jgi:hypothetical protein
MMADDLKGRRKRMGINTARSILRAKKLKEAAAANGVPVKDPATGQVSIVILEDILGGDMFHPPKSTKPKKPEKKRTRPISGGRTRGDKARQAARIKEMQ